MFADGQQENIAINRQQFLSKTMGLEVFGRLRHAIGAARSAEVLRLLYKRHARESDPERKYIRIAPDKIENYWATIADMLATECEQIAAKRLYAADLLEEAQTGRLKELLVGATEPDTSPPPTSRRYIRDPRKRELGKACNWVCRTMHGDQTDRVHRLISTHLDNATPREALGRTPALIDTLHEGIFPEAPRRRGLNPATAYPSSIGGRHLLEIIFKWTERAVWPIPGSAGWVDVALFYLGAIGTIQAYADGNKRTARLAYAITLLRGGRPFVAPTPELESELIQMLGPASS